MDISSYALSNMINWAIIGLIAGFVVHLIDYRSLGFGLIRTLVTGVLGAMLGGVLANLLLGFGISDFNLTSIAIAIIGGLLFAITQRLIFKDTRRFERGVDTREMSEREIPNGDFAYFQQVARYNPAPEQKAKTQSEVDAELLRYSWYQNFVNLAHYPISKRDLVRTAEQLDAEEAVLSRLEGLPDQIFENSQELQSALNA